MVKLRWETIWKALALFLSPAPRPKLCVLLRNTNMYSRLVCRPMSIAKPSGWPKISLLIFAHLSTSAMNLQTVEQVSLWRLPKPDPSQEPLQEHAVGGPRGAPLEQLGKPQGEFGGLQTAAAAMLWSPTGAGLSQGEGLVTLADGVLKRWTLGDGRCE